VAKPTGEEKVGALCTKDDQCATNYCDSKQHCHAKKPVDFLCKKDNQCTTNYCDSKEHCHEKKKNGENSATENHCKSGRVGCTSVCVTGGSICVPQAGSKEENGAFCTKDNQCATNYCTSKKQCHEKKENGEKSATKNHCKSGRVGCTGTCLMGGSICVPQAGSKEENGAICTENNQCATNYCSSKYQCQEKKKNGEKSATKNHCTSGSIAPGVDLTKKKKKGYHYALDESVCTRCTKEEIEACDNNSERNFQADAWDSKGKRQKCQKDPTVVKGCMVIELTMGFGCTCV